MPLNPEQKDWLVNHMKVKKGLFTRKSKDQQIADHTQKYEEFLKLSDQGMKAADEFDNVQIGENKATRLAQNYRNDIQDVQQKVKSYEKGNSKDDLEKVIDTGIKDTQALIDKINKDIKSCEGYTEAREEIAGMLEIMIAFSPDDATMLPILRGVKNNVLEADRTARDGDFKAASGSLKKIKSEVSRLEKLVQDSHTKGHDVILANKVSDIKDSLSKLEQIDCSGKAAKGHEETLEAINGLRKQAKFKDALKKANQLEKSVASSREDLISYNLSYGLLEEYVGIAEKANKKYEKNVKALKAQMSTLHNTNEGVEPKSALKEIKSLLKTGKSLAGKAAGGKEQAKKAQDQNEAKGKYKGEFDQLSIDVENRLKEMDKDPSLKGDSSRIRKELDKAAKAVGTGDYDTALKELKTVNTKIDEQYAQLKKFNDADSGLTSQLDEIRSLLEKNNVAVSVVERLTQQQDKARELAQQPQKLPDAYKRIDLITKAAKDVIARLDKYLQVRKTINDHLEIIESVPIGDTQLIKDKIAKSQTDAEQLLADKPAKATQVLEAVLPEVKNFSEKLAKWAKGKGAEFDKKNNEVNKLLKDLVSGFDLGAAIAKDMEASLDHANSFVGNLMFDEADRSLSELLGLARAAAEHCKKLDEARRSINAFAPQLSKERLKEIEKEHDKLMKSAVSSISKGGKMAEESVKKFTALASRVRDEAAVTSPDAAKTAMNQLVWESALPPFEAVYERFKALPLADEKPRAEFDARHKSALSHVAKGNYEEAVDSLGPLKDIEKVYLPLAKTWETARDAFEKSADASESVYTNYAALATPEQLKAINNERDIHQKQLISDKGATAEQFDSARKATDELVLEMNKTIKQASQEEKAYEKKLKSVRAKLPDLAKDAAASSYQAALAKINEAEQLRFENKFVVATSLLNDLERKGLKELKTQSAAKAEEWKEDGALMKKVKELESEIQKLPSAKPVHHLLTDLRDDLAILKYNVHDLREFENGTKLLEQLKGRLAKASLIIIEDSEHRKKLTACSVDVTKAFQKYSTDAEAVFKKLKEKGVDESSVTVSYKPGSVAGDHKMFSPLSLYKGTWLDKKKEYQSSGSTSAVEQMRKEALAEFSKASKDCTKLLNNEEFEKAAVAAQAAIKETEERKKAYELASKPVLESLNLCDQRGYEEFSSLNDQFSKHDSKVRKAGTYEEKEYKSEFEKIDKACKKLVDPKETNQINKLAGDGAKRLRSLQASHLAYVKANKYPKGMLAEMSRQLKLAESMLDSGNLPAMELGIAKLDEIDKSSRYMKAFDEGYKHNQKFLKETLKKRLEDKSLNEYLPLTVQQLEKDRQELLEEAENLAPDKHLALIEKFQNEVKDAEANKKLLKQAHSDLKDRRKQVDQALSAIGYAVSKKMMKKELLGDFSDKVINLESEIKSSEDPLEANALMSGFDDIMDKIAYYVEHPSQLAADQQMARQDIADTKLKEQEWKETCKTFVAQFLNPARDAVKREGKRGDNGALDELSKFAKDTKEQVLKSHDWSSGESRLKLARDQATQLINEPRGARVSSRKDVSKLAPEWNRIVKDQVNTIDKLLKQALEAAKEIEDKEDMKKLTKALNDRIKAVEVMKPFKANAFDRVCAQLGDDDLTDKEHLASKEQGLQVHRKMLAYLEKDPLVQHLRGNPFQGGVLKPVNDTLGNIDLNLRRFS